MESYLDPAPTITKSYPDGRLTLNETGMRTVPVAIEVIREFVAKHNLLVDLYEWALEAQSPTHEHHEHWEPLNVRVREAIGRATP